MKKGKVGAAEKWSFAFPRGSRPKGAKRCATSESASELEREKKRAAASRPLGFFFVGDLDGKKGNPETTATLRATRAVHPPAGLLLEKGLHPFRKPPQGNPPPTAMKRLPLPPPPPSVSLYAGVVGLVVV